MFNRDTFRLIKKTFNRFFSLVMIVFIGTAFMMGLMANDRVLLTSMDNYNDKYALQDIQLYSSYGFDDDDLAAIRKMDGADLVFGSKMVDAYMSEEGGNWSAVARIEELDRDVNRFMLIDGRLPKADDELVLLVSSVSPLSYPLGSKLSFYLEDSELSESLKNTEFTIVGIAKSPAYTSKVLGTSNLDNQQLNVVVYIPNENFLQDYYSTVYLTIEGASEQLSYTKAYDAFMEDKLDDVSAFALLNQDRRKEKILAEYEEEIKKNEQRLEEEKTKGQAELDSAKKLLDDSNVQLLVGQLEIDTNRETLRSSEEALKISEQMLLEKEQQALDAVAQIEASDPEGRSFDDIYTEMKLAYGAYTALSSIKDMELDLDMLPEQYKKYIKDGADSVALSVQEALDMMDEQAGGSLEDAYKQMTLLDEGLAQIEEGKKQIEDGRKQIADGYAQLEAAQNVVNSGRWQYEQGLKEYKEGVLTFNDEIEKAETEIRKAYQELEDLPGASWMILDRDSHYSSYMYKNTCSQMKAIGYSLPLLFFLVAALVCMTTMTRLVDEQRGQIGIFCALGFTNGQITRKYVAYAVMAALAGSVFGIPIGMALFPTVIYTTWRLMYDLPEMAVILPPDILVICVLSFCVLMAFVTRSVTGRSLKEMPSQLMRPKAPKNAKKVFLEKIKFIWSRLSFTGKITARNLIRYKARFFMTVIGVAGCTGLLVVGWGIKDSISDIIEIQYGRIFDYDYIISLENDHNIDEFMDVLKNDADIDYVAQFQSYNSKVYLEDADDDAIAVQIYDAGDANEILGLRKTDCRTELGLKNNGVLISEKFAKTHGIKKGDTVTIESAGGIKAEVKVSDICEMYFQHYLFISRAYYEQIFNENIHNTSIAICTDAAATELPDVKSLENYISTTDFSGMIRQFETMLEALNFIILVIIITAGSLALVVLINLTQVNISERIREIATLKVLGFRDREVNSYIFKEIMLLSVIGGLVGLPLGVVEHHFIMNIINMDMVMFGNNIRFLSFFYAYLVTIIFTIIVLFCMKKPIKQIEMIESLKSVE